MILLNFIAGTSSDGRHVDEICGQRNYTKMSQSNVLSVVFSSSEIIEYRGFVFQYFARKSSGKSKFVTEYLPLVHTSTYYQHWAASL